MDGSEKDRYHMISLIREIFKKRIRLVKYRKQTGSCKRWGTGWAKWVKGAKRYKPPVIK